MKYWFLWIAALIAAPLPAFAAHEGITPDSFHGAAPNPFEESSGEPIPVDKAFHLSVAPGGASTLKVRFDIADCCYLYRDKVKLSIEGGGARLGQIALPKGEKKVDEFLGPMEVYHQSFEFLAPVDGLAQGQEITLLVGYQGCSEKVVVICYPPEKKRFRVMQTGAGLVVAESAVAPVVAPAPESAVPGEAPGPEANGASSGRVAAILAAFGAGLLLTFTPCVLPMIPIVSGAVVGASGAAPSRLRAGLLSYSYVAGTAVTYTAAGVLAGLTGGQLQAHFQNPWAVGLFALVLVLAALAMFGVFELRMPNAIQARVSEGSRGLKGGSFIGVFLLGIFSALVIGACVSPVLISALGVAIATKDPALGGAIMFSLAHGQGVILVLVGLGAGFLLPKAGMWMERVRQVFGALLIGVAVYVLGSIPWVPVLILWGIFMIVCGVFLGATQRLPEGATGWRWLWKGIGSVLLLWGAAALVGGFVGERDILHPVPSSWSAKSEIGPDVIGTDQTRSTQFERVRSISDLESALGKARSAGKPVVVDFYADWCTDCVRMEKATFSDIRVQRALEGFVLVQPDVTSTGQPEVDAMKQRFGVFGPPATLFLRPDGSENETLRFYGFRDADAFLDVVSRARP